MKHTVQSHGSHLLLYAMIMNISDYYFHHKYQLNVPISINKIPGSIFWCMHFTVDAWSLAVSLAWPAFGSSHNEIWPRERLGPHSEVEEACSTAALLRTLCHGTPTSRVRVMIPSLWEPIWGVGAVVRISPPRLRLFILNTEFACLSLPLPFFLRGSCAASPVWQFIALAPPPRCPYGQRIYGIFMSILLYMC